MGSGNAAEEYTLCLSQCGRFVSGASIKLAAKRDNLRQDFVSEGDLHHPKVNNVVRKGGI